jgi:nucleotide-binding universal stress UspA family protein
MYQKILVPIDGSETSALGLNEAMKIAKSQGSELRLVHVLNEFVLDYSLGAGLCGATVMDTLRAEGRKILHQAEELARQKGLTARSVLVESIGGQAAEFIVAQANKWGADLIVMGTHGRRGLARLAMGSDAEGVTREASVPVLLVHYVREPPAVGRFTRVTARNYS